MGSFHKRKGVLKIVGVFVVLLVGVVVGDGRIYANDPDPSGITTGGGSGASGTATSCSGFIDGYERLCDYYDTGYGDLNGSGGGGASWHIYKTSGSNAYAGPVIEGSGWGIVDGSTTLNDIKKKCTSSEGDDWYVAFGWEGSRIKGHYNRLTGPIHRELYNYTNGKPDPNKPNLLAMARFDVGYGGWQYNNHGALSYDGIQEALDEGADLSNQRISWDAAKKLYKKHTGEKSIPNNIGFFCVSKSDFGSSFFGRSNVASGGETSTGWKQEDAIAFRRIECKNDNGCSVTISHDLERKFGNDSAGYSVYRFTNNKVGSFKSEGNPSGTENFNGVSNGDPKRVYTTTYSNMMPGEYACETMTFNTDNEDGSAATTACFYMYGTKDSAIGIDVNDTTWSSGWKNEVYAKPEDKISLKGWYKPSYQYAKDILVDTTKVGSCEKKDFSVGSAFNRCVDPDWNNAFSINLNGASFSTINVQGTRGNSSSYQEIKDNAYSVSVNDVGKSIEAKAATNTANAIATTPKSVKFEVDGNRNIIATVDKSPISAPAYIKVPYNYVNTTSLAAPEDAIVYAGEKTKVSLDIKVGKKRNGETKAEYATVVPEGKWKLEVCNEQGTWCKTTDESKGKLNESGNLEGEIISKDITVNVPDWSAGSKMCIRSAVYPANSGNDQNYTDKEGNHAWQFSNERVCYTVAKKPNFQVWGGNIYSAKDITTSVAGKTNVAGYKDYDINNKSSGHSYVFGSWGELGVIATGKVRGLASGAGTGYSGIGLTAAPGGSEEGRMSYCNRATLSFANVKCDDANAYTGGIGSDNAMNTAIDDKGDIVKNLIEGNDTVNVTESYVDLSVEDESKMTDKGIYHYNSGTNDLVIGKAEIGYGKKVVVHTEGDIMINGNLYHYGNGEYSSLDAVSRLIIYGKNIKISCDVSRVDALLVADSEVNTCVDSDGNTPDVNSSLRSKQLLINGAIIAGKISMNRTYGAATGKNSMTSAEIVNFDSTLYLWGMRKSKITESGKITTMTLKELSPRY